MTSVTVGATEYEALAEGTAVFYSAVASHDIKATYMFAEFGGKDSLCIFVE